MSRKISPITVTAGPRRPPSRACSFLNSGQTATTIVTAQMPGPMNGRTTQRLPSSSPLMARIDITVRGRLFDVAMPFLPGYRRAQSRGTDAAGRWDETKVRWARLRKAGWRPFRSLVGYDPAGADPRSNRGGGGRGPGLGGAPAPGERTGTPGPRGGVWH